MFSRKSFADMRRAGFGIGISKAKLVQAMLEILLQLPKGTTNLKETIGHHLGLTGQMCSTRDINSAWNDVKKKASKEYPEKFILDGRKMLLWNDGSVKVIDDKISPQNIKKLNQLAEAEKCSVNQMLSNLIRKYQKDRA